MRKLEFEEELRLDELRKRKVPLDYSQNSTEDEEVSDYEIEPDNLYPTSKKE